MQIPAVQFQQSGRTLYATRLSIADLNRLGTVDVWEDEKGWNLDEQGYQRIQDPKHVARIADFLRTDERPFLPTAALLSFREEHEGALKFEELRDGAGFLEIPNSNKFIPCFWIVDYQHRYKGFLEAMKQVPTLKDYIVPAVIMTDVPKFEEVRQFYLINSRQKRVDVDLALALLEAMSTEATEKELMNLAPPGKRFLIRATRVTFAMAGAEGGTFQGRIRRPNRSAADRGPLETVSTKTFANSLQAVISRRSPIHTKTDAEVIQHIDAIWRVLKTKIPEAFATPDDYALLRSPGAYIIHRLLPIALRAAEKSKSLADAESFEKFLTNEINGKKPTEMTAAFWDTRESTRGPISSFSGASGHKAVVDAIKGKMGW